MSNLNSRRFASQLLAERNSSPAPPLFFTQRNLTRNTKFGILKVRASMRKFGFKFIQNRVRRKFTASDLCAYLAAFARKRAEFITAKAKSGKMR